MGATRILPRNSFLLRETLKKLFSAFLMMRILRNFSLQVKRILVSYKNTHTSPTSMKSLLQYWRSVARFLKRSLISQITLSHAPNVLYAKSEKSTIKDRDLEARNSQKNTLRTERKSGKPTRFESDKGWVHLQSYPVT